jgi:hypothetical protein
MHFFISILIFIFILFFYIHLQYQFKTSEDLEIYELDYTTNKNLQEICYLKQPVLFQIDHLKETEPFFLSIQNNSEFKHQDVNVKDIRDYYKPDVTSVDAISLSFSSARGLMETDPKGHFFSENNSDLIRDEKIPFFKMDEYLASPWIIHKNYDLLFGSKNVHTPLKYHTETGRFVIISSIGMTNTEKQPNYIRIKMTPWKSRKHLEIKYDYDNYEFWSPNNIWENPPDKIKCLEFEVKEGFALYIPAYWFYSIEFANNTISVASFTYSTTMNLVSNLPNYTLFFMQQNNIKNLVNTKNITKVYSPSDEKEKEKEMERKETDNKKEDVEENERNQEIEKMLSVITKPNSISNQNENPNPNPNPNSL